METKIMTKEDAQNIVRCTKYILKSENESVNLQRKLFEIGCRWISGCEEIKNEECRYLFVSVNLNITISQSEEIFINNKYTELQVNDVLNIELKDIEMGILKFKVGDKVRVKSLEWYNENKGVFGDITSGEQYIFLEGMAENCGKVFEITEVYEIYYRTDDNAYIWQDWMLEEKPVTEEKPEVEQENKNSMETKEMTQEEVFAYLNNKKILCTSSEESINVQKKLFELGFEWNIPGKTIDELKFLLYIEGKLLKYVLDIDFWVRSLDYTRVEPSEILAIKLKEEKPRFDSKSLQAFDKVLVRNENMTVWHARFLDFYGNGKYNTTSNEVWIYCVPYNEETKHLHGTADEAPEFYRI